MRPVRLAVEVLDLLQQLLRGQTPSGGGASRSHLQLARTSKRCVTRNCRSDIPRSTSFALRTNRSTRCVPGCPLGHPLSGPFAFRTACRSRCVPGCPSNHLGPESPNTRAHRPLTRCVKNEPPRHPHPRHPPCSRDPVAALDACGLDAPVPVAALDICGPNTRCQTHATSRAPSQDPRCVPRPAAHLAPAPRAALRPTPSRAPRASPTSHAPPHAQPRTSRQPHAPRCVPHPAAHLAPAPRHVPRPAPRPAPPTYPPYRRPPDCVPRPHFQVGIGGAVSRSTLA